MVGARIKRNKVFLRRLAMAKSRATRRHLVESASEDELLAVLETCWNVLNFRFPMKSTQRKRLVSHAPYLRKVSRARPERSVRRILQTGGGGALAALLLPVLSGLVGSAISSFVNS